MGSRAGMGQESGCGREKRRLLRLFSRSMSIRNSFSG